MEYAKRIVTLIKQVASNALKPHIICFTGGTSSSCKNTTSSISEAATGYGFFRAICEEVNLDVSKFTFILDDHNHNGNNNNSPYHNNKHNNAATTTGDTDDTLRHVIDKLRSRLGSAALSSSHFTLVSSDYHLIRIQEIHRLSPRQSILFPLDISSATWNCIFAAYPFCVSRDPATAFLGRAVVLANDLDIVLVNLNGAVEDREFVSRENLHRLNETSAKMREMYRLIDAKSVGDGVGMSVGIGDNISSGGIGTNGVGCGVGGFGGVGGNVRFGNETGLGAGFGFQSDMRSHAEMLELAIQDVREVQRLLAPLLTDAGSSVPRNHLAHARSLLEDTVTRIRTSMDPDRILRVHDRLAIIDDLTSFIEQEARKSSMSAQSAPTPPSLPLPPKPLKGDAALKQQRNNNNSNRKIAARVQLANNSTTRSKSDITSSSAASTSVPSTSRTVKNNNNNNNNNKASSSTTSPTNTTQQFSPTSTSQSSAHPPSLLPSPLTSTTTTSSTTTTTRTTTPCSSSSSSPRTSYPYTHHQNQNQQHEFFTSPFPFDTKLSSSSSSSRALSWSDKPLPSPYHSTADSDDELIGGTSVRRLQANDVQVRNIRRRIKSEIRWQDGVNFKGNGKKITRDGPNIVITDNTIPTIPTPRQRTTPPSAASRKKRSSNNSAATSASATTTTTTAATTRRTSTTPAAAAATAAAATSKNNVKTNAGRAGNPRNSAAGSGSRSSTTSRKRQTSASAKKRKGCPTSTTSSTTKTTSAKGGKS